MSNFNVIPVVFSAPFPDVSPPSRHDLVLFAVATGGESETEEDKKCIAIDSGQRMSRSTHNFVHKKSSNVLARLWSRLAASANNRSAVPLICQLVGESDVIEGNAMVERTNGPLHIYFISRDSRWPS